MEKVLRDARVTVRMPRGLREALELMAAERYDGTLSTVCRRLLASACDYDDRKARRGQKGGGR